jgi:hypothetical protein
MIGSSDVYLSVRVSGNGYPSLMMEEVVVDKVDAVFTNDVIQARLSMDNGKMVVKLVDVNVVDYNN